MKVKGFVIFKFLEFFFYCEFFCSFFLLFDKYYWSFLCGLGVVLEEGFRVEDLWRLVGLLLLE